MKPGLGLDSVLGADRPTRFYSDQSHKLLYMYIIDNMPRARSTND